MDVLPVWTERLPNALVSSAKLHWLVPKHLTWEAYSTERYLKDGADVNSSNCAPTNWFERIESCEAKTTALLHDLGLQPVANSDAAQAEAQKILCQADELLSNAPYVRQSVKSFVRSLHMIDSKGPDYDCSFSDPNIPFSIFVSIPPSQGKNRLLRVLEGVVHETMHLQLSAWELLHPIVRANSDEQTWYSPWKKSNRKLQGVLHGMYVFHILAYVYSTLLRRRALSGADESFACARLAGISNELEQVRGVESSPAFTDGGAGLAAAILDRAKKTSMQKTNALCGRGGDYADEDSA